VAGSPSCCAVAYCTADDLLPTARANARQKAIDADLVTACVAPAITAADARLRVSHPGYVAVRGRRW